VATDRQDDMGPHVKLSQNPPRLASARPARAHLKLAMSQPSAIEILAWRTVAERKTKLRRSRYLTSQGDMARIFLAGHNHL
jgi:hypothetical protein